MTGGHSQAQSKNHDKTHNYPFHALLILLLRFGTHAGASRIAVIGNRGRDIREVVLKRKQGRGGQSPSGAKISYTQVTYKVNEYAASGKNKKGRII